MAEMPWPGISPCGAARRFGIKTMRQYFIIVRDSAVALGIDPNAELIRKLDSIPVVDSYCCRPAAIRDTLPPAFVYRVSVRYRKEAEKVPGVVRCRAKERSRYRSAIVIENC